MQRRDSVLKTGEGFTRLPRWLRVKNLCAMQEMQETQARSLSREDRGYGNPLQCSCLENPTESGAWRAMAHRVAQSWTHLK